MRIKPLPTGLVTEKRVMNEESKVYIQFRIVILKAFRSVVCKNHAWFGKKRLKNSKNSFYSSRGTYSRLTPLEGEVVFEAERGENVTPRGVTRARRKRNRECSRREGKFGNSPGRSKGDEKAYPVQEQGEAKQLLAGIKGEKPLREREGKER